ncbi:MAG: phosphotransferase [Chloroflexi bacterium]|nr:phosphotransferase [Chloroflexota bacterium]
MTVKLLNHYLEAWNLSDPQPLTETATSQLYTIRHAGETVILKLLTDDAWAEKRSSAALACFGGHGAVRLYQRDDKAQLIEYADGADLVTLVENGDDAGATRIIAAVLNQLHSVGQPVPCEGVLPLEVWFETLFSKAQADERSGIESIYMRGARVARRLLADPRDIRVLHGDLHHRNIRQSARGWLAFDANGLVGERAYDCANTLCNPYRGIPRHDDRVHNEERLLRNAKILADGMGIDQARVLAFTYAYTCLNACQGWNLQNDDVIQWSLEIAEIIEPHLRVR